MQKKETSSLQFVFTDAATFLGLSTEEQTRLLDGNSPGDPSAFTVNNVGDVAEPLAQLSIAIGLMIDDPKEVRRLMRDTSMPDLEGQSVADCILSRSPQKIARAIKAVEIRLGLN